MTFHEYLQNRRARIEDALAQHLPAASQPAGLLHEAMRYAVLGGGKRLRPLLVYLSGQALGVDADSLDIPACAVELIHAYSLVHDDLPAMDNDDLRRGKPTCHKAYNEATAILVGDALQSLAFELLSNTAPVFSPAQSVQMIKTLASASGSCGMAGGQSLDLLAQGKSLTLTDIEQLFQLKTGALIRASVEMSIIAATDVMPEKTTALRQYATCLGLAFQIQDDILDIEGNIQTLGKSPGNDQKNQKSTYPAIMGLAQAKTQVNLLRQQAENTLLCFNAQGDYLRQLLNETLKIRQ